MQQAVEFAHQEFGPIEVLINNAGYGLMGALETVPISEARRQLEVNTLGPMRLVQLIAPDMRAQGWGRIVNVSSIAGRMVIPLGGWYSASKFALEALADELRLELEPFGIYTTSILPGPVKTDFMQKLALTEVPAEMPELYRALSARVKSHRQNRTFEVSGEYVARIILKAVAARKPRTRYILTLPARVGNAIRPLLTDRAWDRLMKVFYGITDLCSHPQKN